MSSTKKSARTKLLGFFITTAVFLFFSPFALAETVTLAWDRPEGDSVAGYKVYYGLSGENYKDSPGKTINSPDQTQVDIDNLESGETYAFSATSHDGNGNESAFSEEITHQMPLSREEEQYTISASAGTGGSIDPDGDTSVSNGESVSYAISPDAGYKISDVLVNRSSKGTVSEYTFSNVNSDNTITASFSIKNGGDDDTSEDQPDEPSPGLPDDDDISEDQAEKPVPRLPDDNKVFSSEETIVFETEAYYHPQGNAHGNSHWQIRRFDEKKPFYDVTSDIDLTFHEFNNGMQNGLKYAWRVGFEDMESGYVSWSDERRFILGESVLNNKMPAVAPGESIFDYQMISFVHFITDPCSKKVFEPLQESNDTSDYRVLAYDPSKGRSGGYHQLGDFEVVPGRAYWVLARNGLDLTMDGVPVTTSSDIRVPLDYNSSNDNGWSMIAVPNNASYYWGDVEIIVYTDNNEILFGPLPIKQLSSDNPYINKRIWEWNSETKDKYTSHTSKHFTLTPYGGYWVKARAENVSLSFPHDMQLSGKTPEMNHSEFAQTDNDLKKAAALDKESANEKPPMPLSGLDGNANPEEYTHENNMDGNNGGSESSGCFVGSLSSGPAK